MAKIYKYLTIGKRSPVVSYGLVLLCVVPILFAHNQFVDLVWRASPFLMFLPSVLIVSWYGGFLPGLVATIVATLVGDYFFLTPLYTFTIADISDSVRLLLFSTVGLLISIINQTFYNQKAEKEELLEKLELSEERFKRIANTTPVMLWILDQDMIPVFINNTFQEYIGSIENKNWLHEIHSDDKDVFKRTVANALKEKKQFQLECRIRKNNSLYHWMLITGVPNITIDNSFLGFLGTCIDIQEQKQLEQQKTTFLSTVAHEFRTPLATAQLINQLLIKKFSNKTETNDLHDLENMNDELESLSHLIHELLQFVRGEQGDLPIHTANVSLTELIQVIAKNYQQLYPKIHFVFEEKKDIFAKVDAKRIKQVLYNLLDNAIAASAPNGKISIVLTKNDTNITASVEDNGTGIPATLQKHIFKRYFQASDHKRGGFGLGLYISKQIIQKHHGKIWLASTPKKGSIFYFSLPVSS